MRARAMWSREEIAMINDYIACEEREARGSFFDESSDGYFESEDDDESGYDMA